MTNYPVGDFLIRLKNAANAGLKEVSADSTKQIRSVSEALKKAGYIEDVVEEDGIIKVKLSIRSKQPVLANVKLISRPGLRVYMEVKDLGKKRGPSIYLVSSSRGVLTSKEALKQRVGGEVIAEIW